MVTGVSLVAAMMTNTGSLSSIGFLVSSRPDPRYLTSSHAPSSGMLPTVMEERRRKGFHDDSDVVRCWCKLVGNCV